MPGREGGLVFTIWFPYRRWLLLVILNLSTTIAVRASLTIIYPAAAITMWTNLHCQAFHVEILLFCFRRHAEVYRDFRPRSKPRPASCTVDDFHFLTLALVALEGA